MSKDERNELKFFLYVLYRHKSEERLKKVKKGQHLAKTLNLPKQLSINYIQTNRDSLHGAEYEPVDKLLSRKIERFPKDLTHAMKEYISSKVFSPQLERKKN